MPIPFRSVLAVEGVQTSDRRIINPGALTWRDLPLSLMAIIEDSHGGMPTTTSVNVGRIDTIAREDAADLGDGAKRLAGTGVFDDEDPVAAAVARKVAEKYLRGISIDVGDVESELEVIEEDEDGWPTDWLDRLTAGTIGMATVCGFPAFADAYIEIDDEAALAASAATAALPDGHSIPAPRGEGWRLIALVAAAGPPVPPRAWFEDPALDGPTPVTIGDDGRVFGHLACWGTEHRALPGVTPPRSPSGYAHFHLGATRVDDGVDIPTGVLTIGTGHAALRGLSVQAAIEHYDNTGTAWADARAGEDEYGIWIAGAVRPGVSENTIREARGSALSGDWRTIGGGLDMIAALSVNVPGFPVVRPALAASAGEPYALVAAGALPVLRTATARYGAGTNVAQAVEAAVARALAPVVNRQRREDLRARMARS